MLCPQLSKEVAVLLRERDDLMAMMGAGPAGPGGLSAMGLGAHAAPPAMTGKSSQARGRGPTGAAKSGKGRPR